MQEINENKFEHQCIKCSTVYRDSDSDPYLCDRCKNAKLAIAREIDKKYEGRSTVPPVTPLMEYDNAPKVNGFMRVRP